jgi:hypothetical protein
MVTVTQRNNQERTVAGQWSGWFRSCGEPNGFGVNNGGLGRTDYATSIAILNCWIFSMTSLPFGLETGIKNSVSRIWSL